MKSITLKGSNKLQGSVNVSGSKNAALPCISAALLTKKPVLLRNIPNISDVKMMIAILKDIGVDITYSRKTKEMRINSNDFDSELPKITSTIRGSTLLLGSILAINKEVIFYNFGGCDIGNRPIDIHLKGFRKLGVKSIKNKNKNVLESEKLKANKIKLRFPSVGATENLILIASKATGKTIIKNAAVEPEILDLINMLKKMGVTINCYLKTRQIMIKGMQNLKGVKHKIIPDRIEAGTYIIAGAITKSNIVIKSIISTYLTKFLEIIKKIGIEINVYDNKIHIFGKDNTTLNPIKVETNIYPGFPTDLQPILMTLLTQINGTSIIKENVWKDRFHHVKELKKMGAEITINKNIARIHGHTPLKGTNVICTNIRGGAALLIAAIKAKGESKLLNPKHILRGYENIFFKLKNLGVNLES